MKLKPLRSVLTNLCFCELIELHGLRFRLVLKHMMMIGRTTLLMFGMNSIASIVGAMPVRTCGRNNLVSLRNREFSSRPAVIDSCSSLVI